MLGCSACSYYRRLYEADWKVKGEDFANNSNQQDSPGGRVSLIISPRYKLSRASFFWLSLGTSWDSAILRCYANTRTKR